MANLVLLSPIAPPSGGDACLFVNLDRVLTIRSRQGGGAQIALLAHDGVAIELEVRESPHDIVALARLDPPFAASQWRDELDGDLTDFHLGDAGVLKAALVDGETGGLANFALDASTRTWTFLGIEEPADDGVVKAASDTAWPARRAGASARALSGLDDGRSDRERLADGARRALNVLSSRHAPGTSNGKLACAWAVNEIAHESLGRRIGGGLSTIRMYDALRASADVVRTAPEPGDIVISPTQGRVVGHVGIVLEADGRIASNSSMRALFVQNYSMASWRDYFVTRKNLGMHLFRIRDLPA